MKAEADLFLKGMINYTSKLGCILHNHSLFLAISIKSQPPVQECCICKINVSLHHIRYEYWV